LLFKSGINLSVSGIIKMKRTESLKIERKSEVLLRIGLSRSTLHSKIQKGLWCPPIPLGARAVGFIEHETDELIAAHINGYSPDQLRELVSKLVLERAVLLGGES
jgi:prophage regulatory protein